MLVRRAPIQRKTRLKARKPMLKRRITPRRSSQQHDESYLAWIRALPCCCHQHPEHPGRDAHHPRHELGGGPIGAGLKADDRRAVPLSRQHHQDLHALSGPFRGWTGDMLRQWLDEKGEALRCRYERLQKNVASEPV